MLRHARPRRGGGSALGALARVLLARARTAGALCDRRQGLFRKRVNFRRSFCSSVDCSSSRANIATLLSGTCEPTKAVNSGNAVKFSTRRVEKDASARPRQAFKKSVSLRNSAQI